MTIKTETSLRCFDFWGGAKDNALELTCEQLDTFESMLEDAYPDGITDTEINDMFWFDFEIVRAWLGLTDED